MRQRIEYDPVTGEEMTIQTPATSVEDEEVIDPDGEDEVEEDVQQYRVAVNGASGGCTCSDCVRSRVKAMERFDDLLAQRERMGELLAQIASAYGECAASDEAAVFQAASNAIENLFEREGLDYDGSGWREALPWEGG